MTHMAWQNLITRDLLKDLAGTKAFQRGEEYFFSGAVERLLVSSGKITAKVVGSEAYRVQLWEVEDDLGFDCSCPRAGDGYFCKHAVAVGLAWLAQSSGTMPGRKGRELWREIRQYLSGQPVDVLVDLLMDVSQRDDRLFKSLSLKAERSLGGDGVEAFRHAIDEATRTGGFVDWREAADFASAIGQVADSLAELLKPDSAATLVELTEYAIERVEQSLEEVDDSNGEVGDVVYRMGELHFDACRMARPDPEALAERLFRLETTLPFKLPEFDPLSYQEVLGKEGLRRYRELAEAEWAKIKPGDRAGGFDYHRSNITRLMENLVEATGDVEELVAIKSRDLSTSHRYLDIAETLAEAKQMDKALEWAERGLTAFPGRPDNRLRDFLVAAYLKRKRFDEGLRLTWVQFEEHSGLDTYKKLHGVASQVGDWPAQRERALKLLVETIQREASETTRWKPQSSAPNYSRRVEIALWEADLDAAWTAVQQGVCDISMMIELADRLEPSRPDDALKLYRRVIPPIVEETNNAAYAQAIGLIRRIGKLMPDRKETQEFSDYLAELRVRFKPKRNFIKLLDDVVLSVRREKNP